MISHISATYLYPVIGPPIKNGVLAINSDGIIEGIFTEEEAQKKQIKDIKHYDGLLAPGFVNTHCHLELSNLKSKIPQHTGLPEFVKSVMRQRFSDEDDLDAAMLRADAEMFENGIVAVGDISNQAVSKTLKKESTIYYHTFLEVMGFNPDRAKEIMGQALKLEDEFDLLPVSIVPHAPYSVSPELLKELRQHIEPQSGLVSIHNQETAAENEFFEHKGGAFLDLYQFLGLDIEFYKASGRTSLQTILPLLSPNHKTLLVHNTYTSAADVVFAQSIHPDLYWCLCPRANLYIENRLPDVNMMRTAGLKITLGTDSLASNIGLNILSEMNILQGAFNVPSAELIKWATLNGAEFLGIESKYGSLEVGKRPGINVLGFTEKNGQVVLGDVVKRLF